MAKEIPTIGLDYVFTFGKHKGEDFKTVCKKDSQYIQWCEDNRILILDYKCLVMFRKYYKRPSYGGGYLDDDDASEMDFCMGLSGGGQGW